MDSELRSLLKQLEILNNNKFDPFDLYTLCCQTHVKSVLSLQDATKIKERIKQFTPHQLDILNQTSQKMNMEIDLSYVWYLKNMD